MSTAPSSNAPRSVPGRYVVLAMLAFGVLSTAGIWVYWKLHLAPFMPLQQALENAYPGSSPRAEGGRHKDSPPILRLVLTVDFAPNDADPRAAAMIGRIIAIAREHIDLGQYEELEIYLVHRPPEKSPRQYEYKRQMSEVLKR